MRNQFIFFSSWWTTAKMLPEELWRPFIEGVIRYGLEDAEPTFSDLTLKVAWENIKPVIDRANASYDNGKKGGRPKAQKGFKTPLLTPSETPLSNDKDKDKDKDKDNPPLCPPQGGEVSYDTLCNKDACAKSKKKETKAVKFVPPTVEEVRAYLTEKGITNVDAEAFVAFYESKGWMVGKNKMQKWRSAIATWQRNGYGQRNAPQPAPRPNIYGDMSIGTPAQRYEVPDIPAWK